MTTAFLAPAQLQLLNHVVAWGTLRIAEISCDPFAVAPAQKGISNAPAPLPSELGLRYLDRIRHNESILLKHLGLDAAALERAVAPKDGPSFNAYILDRHPPWMEGAIRAMGRMAVDDLWQARQARMNIAERIIRWKRTFGAQEKADSRPNVVGFQNHLTWLQETYAYRNFFVQQLERKFRPGWELVEAFYDPTERAAQNILDGAAALRKYLKVTANAG